MIWYEQKVSVKGQPEGSTITLTGIYDDRGSRPDIITIALSLMSKDINKEVVVYTHNPSMMHHESPSSEDVLRRYQAKINKYLASLNELDYDAIFKR